MKTIEQAAKESSEKAGYNPKIASDIIGKTVYECAFKAGVIFSQRWIPVEEELPEKNIDVIAKSNNTFWIARLQPHGKGLTLYSIKGSRYSEEFEATHWRPISFL